MRFFVILGVALTIALLVVASLLVLPACGIGPGGGIVLHRCPAPLAGRAEAGDATRNLARDRTELERRIARLQAELSDAECRPAPLPPEQAEVDGQAWQQGDLAVLEGCWTLEQIYRLRHITTGDITEIRDWQVCFDAAGQGTQTLRSTHGITCESPISGRFDTGGALRMRDPDNVPCSDSSYIFQRDITCNLTTEQTVLCGDVQPEIGTRSEPYRMRRN